MFLDSSGVLDDAERLQRRMERDGYLFLNRFFARSLVLGVRRRLREMYVLEQIHDPCLANRQRAADLMARLGAPATRADAT